MFSPRTGMSLLVWAAFVLLPCVRAQGKGVVEGRLVNGTDPSIAAAGVEIDAVALVGNMSALKSTVTDASGRFRIQDLPTDVPLMIRANYQTASYTAQVRFDSGGKAGIDLQVFESTTSWSQIRLDGVQMAFQLVGDHLQSIESYALANETKPPHTHMNPAGNFRFSKAEGLHEPPRLHVAGPGTTMPLVQPPLESPDGQSYYSLYPLRPGVTTFEVLQVLPYHEHRYVYRKKFYNDVSSFEIGVIPKDIAVSGGELTRVKTDDKENFAVYSGGPVKAGTELVMTFSGGTPTVQPAPTEPAGQSRVSSMPTAVVRNALVIGPLLLMGLVVVLWYAFNHVVANPHQRDPRARDLRQRREDLLNYLASLDNRYQNQSLERGEYLRQRESGKRQLRRVVRLLGR